MGIIIATLIVVVVIASALAQDFAIFSWDYWLEGGNALRSEVVRNLGLLAAAAIGLVVGSWRAVMGYMQARAAQAQAAAATEQARLATEQARLAEQGHITERFSRAVEQLGHDRVTVRIGGLYALKRIAEDSVERDHLAVMDVITNFIRQPPYAAGQVTGARQDRKRRVAAEADQIGRADQIASAAAPPPEPYLIDCPDIVAAIEIIQSRSEDQKAVEKERNYGFGWYLPSISARLGKKWEYRLPLTRASLSYLRLPEIDLRIFALAGANFTGTELTRARFVDSPLTLILQEAANFTGANLTNAILTDANFTGANLTAADLTGANLTGVNFTGANLTDANFTDAYFTGANLTDADLTGANLAVADLADANFTGAILTDADLTAANLTGVNNLTQEQLDSACVRKSAKPLTLPEGLKPPQKVCEPVTQ